MIRAERIPVKDKADIKKKIALFKKLYQVENVEVYFYGYFWCRDWREYSKGNDLSCDLRAISIPGKYIPFRWYENQENTCTISIYSHDK